MPRYIAHVNVMLRPLVNDPQGLVVAGGLQSLGFTGVESVRAGKRIDITLEAASEAAATTAVREMCQKLLANPVIEDFEFEVAALATASRCSPWFSTRTCLSAHGITQSRNNFVFLLAICDWRRSGKEPYQISWGSRMSRYSNVSGQRSCSRRTRE